MSAGVDDIRREALAQAVQLTNRLDNWNVIQTTHVARVFEYYLRTGHLPEGEAASKWPDTKTIEQIVQDAGA